MSGFSINTNVEAQTALRTLTATHSRLAHVQTQLGTGLKVAGAGDDSAVFAVAQGIRASLAGYDCVNESLNNTLTTVSVALNGVQSISGILSDITRTLTSLADGTIDDDQRIDYTGQLKTELDSVQTVLTASVYNGVNLIAPVSPSTTLAHMHAVQSVPALLTTYDTSGDLLNLQSYDLYGAGDTSYTAGLVGLLRLGYYVGTAPSNFSNFDLYSTSRVYLDTTGHLVSRSIVQQNEALAALAGISASAYAYVSQPGQSGRQSAFGSTLASFSQQVNSALGVLGADYTNIDSQISFNQSLEDANTASLGTLVDANLAQTSAQLVAIQTQQNLATQALAIANQEPKLLLNLFRNAA